MLRAELARDPASAPTVLGGLKLECLSLFTEHTSKIEGLAAKLCEVLRSMPCMPGEEVRAFLGPRGGVVAG